MPEVYKCKECGGSLALLENGLGKCQYCGALQTLPRDQSDKIKNSLNRANDFRLNCDFDRAIYKYEKVIELNEAEPEAHWGLFLSKYGVEYVKDPITYTNKPTLHRISSISVFDDIDYQATMKYALPLESMHYKADAENIEMVMKELLLLSANQEPYDIFLSYKEADDITRQRTDDSYLAHDLYNELTAQGYKVFFAPKSLGVGLYEPKIYSAIISSKVMIVLGTKPKYFDAVWVKNEWSRYAELIEHGEPKVLVPVYKNMDAGELPNRLAKCQAYDMSSMSFLPMLLNAISTTVSKSKPKINFNKDVSAEDNFIERGRLALETGNFAEAEQFIESALNINAHNSQAYFYKLMIEMRITKQEYISTSTKYLNEYVNFERAVNFADHELKITLLKYEEQVKQSLDTQKYSKLLNALKTVQTKDDIVSLRESFQELEHLDNGNIEKLENAVQSITAYENTNSNLTSQYEVNINKINILKKKVNDTPHVPLFMIIFLLALLGLIIYFWTKPTGKLWQNILGTICYIAIGGPILGGIGFALDMALSFTIIKLFHTIRMSVNGISGNIKTLEKENEEINQIIDNNNKAISKTINDVKNI